MQVAILWHEMWHEALEEASRLWFGQQNVEGTDCATLIPYHISFPSKSPDTLKIHHKESILKDSTGKTLEEQQLHLKRTPIFRYASGARSIARGDVSRASHAERSLFPPQFWARFGGRVSTLVL
jgi:hypothetical protein